MAPPPSPGIPPLGSEPPAPQPEIWGPPSPPPPPRSPVTSAALDRFFIGTSVSTFSFRIHEEREILGLDPRTTYNRFCGDREEPCEQPAHWRVAY